MMNSLDAMHENRGKIEKILTEEKKHHVQVKQAV